MSIQGSPEVRDVYVREERPLIVTSVGGQQVGFMNEFGNPVGAMIEHLDILGFRRVWRAGESEADRL